MDKIKNHPENIPESWLPWVLTPGTKSIPLCMCDDCCNTRKEFEKFNIEQIIKDLNILPEDVWLK
jgi:hypothetical protein